STSRTPLVKVSRKRSTIQSLAPPRIGSLKRQTSSALGETLSAPFDGVMRVTRVTGGVTTKSIEFDSSPPTVTVNGPERAPAGTVTMRELVVLPGSTIAGVPAKLTTLRDGSGLKLVPTMAINWPSSAKRVG